MWIVFALLAAICAGGTVALSKAGIKTVDPTLVFAVQAILILIISWLFAFVQKTATGISQIDKKTWIYLVLAGILTSLSSIASFHALKLGNASSVSPLTNLSLVFTVIFGVLFLKENLSLQVLIGVLLMAAGAVVIAVAKKSM
jgi:transporter family protein